MLNTRRRILWCAAGASYFVALSQEARAERPIAPALLPEQTVAYCRVASMPELQEKFKETTTGRMAHDEQLKPLLGQLWQAAVDAFKQAEEQVGAPLNDLLAIPQGEVCVAIVAPTEGRPQVIAWLDCGYRILTMQKLLERGRKQLENQDSIRITEVISDVELVVYELQSRRQRKLAYFIKDNTFVLSSDVNLAKQLLAMWNGQQEADTMT